jgi:hypothetical protein
MPLQPRLSDQDRACHRTFIEEMGAKAIWLKYWIEAPEKEDA